MGVAQPIATATIHDQVAATNVCQFNWYTALGLLTSAKFTQEFIRVDACLKTDTRYILFDSGSNFDVNCDFDFDSHSDCDYDADSDSDSDVVVAFAKLGP